MSVNLTVNGVVYAYPELDDENWASAATGWAQAVTAGMLQKAGGTFTLTADADFGASYGLKAIFKSRSANIASAGVLRLANTDTFGFRNAANSADLLFSINAANNHLIFDGVDLSASSSSGNVVGPGSSTDNALARFDGITGQLIQNSAGILSDAGALSGLIDVTLDNGVTHGGRVNFNGGSSSYVGSSADGATLEVAGFTDASVPAGVANDIRDATTRTTGTSVGVGGVAISGSSTTYSRTSSTYGDITNLSVTITTNGKPVRIACIGDTANSARFGFSFETSSTGAHAGYALVKLVRDSTDLCVYEHSKYNSVWSSGQTEESMVPVSVVDFLDTPAAGTYTYKLQARIVTTGSMASAGMFFEYAKLIAYEL